jgi:hypothetical protein
VVPACGQELNWQRMPVASPPRVGAEPRTADLGTGYDLVLVPNFLLLTGWDRDGNGPGHLDHNL